jgi:hypothetical protein
MIDDPEQFRGGERLRRTILANRLYTPEKKALFLTLHDG